MQRHDADAHVFLDHTLDGLLAAQLHRHPQRHTGLRKKLIDQTPRVAAALAENESLARERVSADRALLRELVARRSDRHQLVFAESLGLDAAHVHGKGNEGDVHFARENLIHEHFAGPGSHGDLRGRMLFA